MKIEDFIIKNRDVEILEYNEIRDSVIYFICEADGEILYIGSTVNLIIRLQSHFSRPEFYSKRVFFFKLPLEDCREVEKKLINEIKPKHNTHYINGGENRVPLRSYNKVKIINKDSIRRLKLIKKLMFKNKISQTKLASCMGISKQYVNQLLNNLYIHESALKNIENNINKLLTTH